MYTRYNIHTYYIIYMLYIKTEFLYSKMSTTFLVINDFFENYYRTKNCGVTRAKSDTK